MSPTNLTTRARESQRAILITACFIINLHCPSCVQTIRDSLSALHPAPEDIVVSIVAHSVIIRHSTLLSVAEILDSLEATGFEVHSIFQDDRVVYESKEVTSLDGQSWNSAAKPGSSTSPWTTLEAAGQDKGNMHKKMIHLAKCEQCKVEQGGISPISTTLDHKEIPIIATSPKTSLEDTLPAQTKLAEQNSLDSAEVACFTASYKATLALSGMTCSSCVSSITHAVKQLPSVHTVNVNLLTNSGVVLFTGKQNLKEIIETIEDCGFEASVEELEEITTAASKPSHPKKQRSDKWQVVYTVGGMTCGSCVGHVTKAIESLSCVDKVEVNLIAGSASVVFQGKEHLASIKSSIEVAGYTAVLDRLGPTDTSAEDTAIRTVSIHIDGMFCDHCPENVKRRIREALGSHSVEIEETPFSLESPILQVKYLPSPPDFTIRQIFDAITGSPIGANSTFKPSVCHPPTIEERAKAMHMAERRKTLCRLIVCTVVAIPTFILGIVFMSLIPADNHIRQYLMKPLTGNATRLSWALFILSTPVFFYSASSFHIRALRELRAMWRKGSRTPLWHRFTRFGSMNMLMSLGTTIAFVASIAELGLAATKKSSGSMENSYFDAVVFLSLFLLTGRFLEAFSKAKTGDAVTSLGALRPKEAILVAPETGDIKIATDLLEIGDVVRVHHGTSPPFDGVVLEGTSNFDESSLTGESRPVKKGVGDYVYSGTVNRAAPVKVKITTISGTSMLDQIINAVREGQTHRAPVERVADTITAHFVPFVITIAIVTWLIWLVLGTTGAIPKEWKDEEAGGWALWSLRFAIAVFVIACPCGIGLAAPTALFVGGGLAAKHGILVRGGGEAFQEASSLNCIVFDKTGTLTKGGDPTVTDHKFTNSQDSSLTLGLVRALEENSGHPIAQALVSFCSAETSYLPTIVSIDEIPGKGLKGTFDVEGQKVTAVIGNEAHLADHNVAIPPDMKASLECWKARGESIALMAVLSAQTEDTWQLACIFAISDPLRPEAIGVIRALKKRGIDVWMLSGDNTTTANAVGAQVGIPVSNIIAGVLPDEKAKKIEYLQQVLTKPQRSTLFRIPFLGRKSRKSQRATIAMVGDGINDAPALSTADLSIAIGSGSDIALSSSSFILINSELTTILTLLDLSRVVFRRVYFNFGWATVYNLVAMPIAAGVLYPIKTGGMMDDHGMHSGGKHVRLDPVWASLAMALSSLSVVCSSLALRSRIPGVGFKVKKEEAVVGTEVEGDITQIV